MSGVCQCEGHAQFHSRKLLKASSPSDSLWLHRLSVLSPSLFSPQELQSLILNCLALVRSRSGAFIMLTPNWWQVYLFFSTCFLRWGLRKLTCLPLDGTYEKLVFKKYHQSQTYGTTALQKTVEIVNCVWGTKNTFLSSPDESCLKWWVCWQMLKQLQFQMKRTLHKSIV